MAITVLKSKEKQNKILSSLNLPSQNTHPQVKGPKVDAPVAVFGVSPLHSACIQPVPHAFRFQALAAPSVVKDIDSALSRSLADLPQWEETLQILCFLPAMNFLPYTHLFQPYIFIKALLQSYYLCEILPETLSLL